MSWAELERLVDHAPRHVPPNISPSALPCMRLEPSNVGGRQPLFSHPKAVGCPVSKMGVLVDSFLDSSV